MGELGSPISYTPLSQQGKSLQSGLLTARLGLATNVASLSRTSDHARILNNYHMFVRDIWTNQGIGWLRQRAGSFNAGGTFLDFSFFVDNAGTQTLLFQVGTKLYSYNIGTSTETEIKTGLNATALPCIRRSYSPTSGQSIAVYCNGIIEPRKILTPATEAALAFNTPGAGVWPGTFNTKSYSKPKFCTPFMDRFVYGGFPDATTAFDVLIACQGDPEKFVTTVPQAATDAGAFTYPPELGQLTALTSLQLNNQSGDEVIIGGCTNGVFIITGNQASNFSLRVLTRSFGIPSNRCFVPVGNDLIFLSTNGIRAFSSLANNATLVNDTFTFLIQDLVNLIDTANWQKSHAIHYPNTQEIWFWLPLTGDGANCKHALVLNYNNDASGGGNIAPIWSTRDGTSVACSIYFNNKFYGGGYDGLLQQWYQGNLYDTTPIISQISQGLITVGNPNQKSSMRNVSVITDGGVQKFTIRANIYSKKSGDGAGGTQWQKAPATPASQILSSIGASQTSLGTWILGSSAFPSNHIKVLDFQPGGNGQFWDVDLITNASDDALDYYGLAYTLSGGGIER